MASMPGTTPSEAELSMVPSLAYEQRETSSPPDEQVVETTADQTPSDAEATQTQELDEGASQVQEVATDAEAGEVSDAQAEKRTAGYEDFLPLKQADEYPEQLYELAAKRWNLDEESLKNESIRSLLKDKINSDIQINQHQKAEEARGPAGDEQPEAEPEPEQSVQPIDLNKAIESEVERVKPLITPEGSKAYVTRLSQAYEELGKAQEDGDEAAISQAHQEVTQTQMAFLRVAMNTLLPNMVREHLESVVSETESGAREAQDLYTKARALAAKDPNYSDIAEAYKSGQFAALLKEFPEITEKQFKGPNGKLLALGTVENTVAQYQYGMRLIRGRTKQEPEKSFAKGKEAGIRTKTDTEKRADLARTGKGRTASGAFAGPANKDGEFQQRMVNAFEGADPLARSK